MPSALDRLAPTRARVSSTSDQIADALRRAIADGLLPAGAMLRQDDIAARFEVSKIPVREALKRLEAEGLVRFNPHRGAVVASLSAAALAEYLEIRALLEGHAAALAAPRITDEQLAEARARLDDFACATEPARRGALNWAFHAALYQAAERPLLVEEIRALHHKVERYVAAAVERHADTEMPKTRGEHEAILAAFTRRDADAAACLTRAHVRGAGASLLPSTQDQSHQGDTR
ncbi:GntR family transcriptional regulator [Pseudothauera nasutitermitis]|uniref:GntR family transcriptional regulator n=1 Tax=Pseudothauera nasutitermitis TaxID=2565930 RepID=A0A4S4AQ54_9RHOO|nr:GntR family transcriptional regulator [Pseudothauera nasutitermitis]THF61865.1 GntR family transcriptional regulator [Pseudothauera nasutitermitis]